MKNTDKALLREKVFQFYASHRESCDEIYNMAEDKNIGSIYTDISNSTEINSLYAKVAVVIITANKYEKNILHKRAFLQEKSKIYRIDIDLMTACSQFNRVFAYWMELDGYPILHIHANVTGSYTVGGSADIVRWVLTNNYLMPTAIISFGICFGTEINENVKLGAVVISKKVYPYFIGAKINGEALSVVDDNVFGICPNFVNIINLFSENNLFNDLLCDVLFENYITGEAVVSSKRVRDKFTKTTTQPIFAGEMEGYGLFKECNSGTYNVPCLIVKSICDWGAEKNFDVRNDAVVKEFREALCSENDAGGLTGPDLISILGSLKNRIQAYSANCAFDVLYVLLKNGLFDRSIFSVISEKVQAINGAATSCKTIGRIIEKAIGDLKLGYVVNDAYLHRCVMLLKDAGIVQCDESCVELNPKDKCLNSNKITHISLLKGV